MKSSPFEKHFRHYRHCYIAGAGDQHFHMVRSAISKAIEAKYPSRDRADDEPDRRGGAPLVVSARSTLPPAAGPMRSSKVVLPA